MRAGALLLFFLCLFGYGAFAQDAMHIPKGNPDQGRLIFAQCRTCHYPEKGVGHNNGPSLHQIFGKVVGSQQGFEYYSEFFTEASFIWTPALMFHWLANPMQMFPESTMMSLGVIDPQERADLIAYLVEASE